MHRIRPLDSLRGIAACTVVIDHLSLASGIDGDFAHCAVMLFFVLSGFVLTMPWVRGEPPRWGEFLIRRCSRLWPPVVVTVAVAVCVYALVGPDIWDAGLHWRGSLTAGTIERCISMIGPTGGCRELVLPLWSLTYEARISLIFPILAVVTLRAPVAMLVLAVVWGLPGDIQGTSHHWLHMLLYVGGGFVASVRATMHYGAEFVFGSVAAVYSHSFGCWMRGLLAAQKAVLLAIAIALISVPADTAEGAGAALLILMVVAAPEARVLMWAPLRWAGRVSYSLYLIHGPILVLGMWLFAAQLTPIDAVVVAVTAGLAAEVMYRLVEVPSNGLGRRMARLLPTP